jgi:hypothetical protein
MLSAEIVHTFVPKARGSAWRWIRHRGVRYIARAVVLFASAGCGGDDDGPNADAGADRIAPPNETGTLDDARSVDVSNDGMTVVDSTSGDSAIDSRADASAPETSSDRRIADSTGDSSEPRLDAVEAGPLDVTMGDADGASGSDADAATDRTADRSDDVIRDSVADAVDGGLRKPSGVFGGGPFYHDADTVMPAMRASGFSTMILWSIHIHSNGDLVLNDVPIFSNGAYNGSDASWPSKVASLKTSPTSVTRIEFSVGAGGTADFETIESLVASQGTGPSSILYKNFSALRAAIPATDAIDFDDESNYDVASTVAFGVMLADLGYKVTLCPYTNSSFWTSVYNQTNGQRPGVVDRVLLQVYAGGASNNPVTWSGFFGGLKVEAGLWSRHGTNCSTGDTPATVRSKMTGWANDIGGGWMWLLDDLLACQAPYPIADYAAAINGALNP